jgi:hypothetical protein
MCWHRGLDLAPLPVRHDEQTLSELGHAVVSGVQEQLGYLVLGTMLSVDAGDLTLDEFHTVVLTAVTEAADILQQEDLWQEIFNHV